MRRAIEVAKQGSFTTTPNPNVGCVIVNKNNQIIGEGFHHQAGSPHAEVHALKMVGKAARGTTVYVTLEPCSHFGRTPPCANALVEANVKRVVIAMQDPNPQVAGKGIAILQAAGIEVVCGVLENEAEKINTGFLKRMRTGLPYVQLKMAASLDGKTAMASGESKWITSAVARQDVQVLRAQSSVILSTSATVLADDPSLTVRLDDFPQMLKATYPLGEVRQPVRVILDSQNRLTLNEKVFKQDGETWLVRKSAANLTLPDNVKLIVEDSPDTQINLSHLMQILAEKQINTVFVEAGASLAGALVEQNLVDELIVYLAPKLLGHNARDLCLLPHLTQLSQAPQFSFTDLKQIGDDVRLTLTRKG
ncbi:bifunctional diaminohydroxyphosphoribosylaminopyrimidine deaminase/5-amino-6-(5-phosphoribosylamino)uracil reductase RibD [Zophobihabitans entericus]|uniref:Riboflavin biosynthesis protein RibD n=1 Tax=Zophobihabitans entericus TaxID=1635327 RepID=A0A6G9IDS2_9GAMM|nr:bifunctional diaminohydroxyphosphoribosylaminopyrimidine deaminase/5-amino-6-(5-phosphoribosylamino)uracil reductase RibD [Zophobihabitans entericus]